MVARLLRQQVRLDLILGLRLEDAELCAALAVCIVVERTVTVEAHLAVVSRHREDHREIRDFRQALDCVVVELDLDRTIRDDRVRHAAGRERLCRQLIREADGDRACLVLLLAELAKPVELLPVARIIEQLFLDAAAVEARELPLRRHEVAAAAVVVVDRRAPERRLRSLLDELYAIALVGREVARSAREHDLEARAAHAEVDVAVDDVQRFLWLRLKLHVRRVVEAARTLGEVRRADSFLRLRHLNLIDMPRALAEGNLKASLSPESVFLEAQRRRDRLLTRIRQRQVLKRNGA